MPRRIHPHPRYRSTAMTKSPTHLLQALSHQYLASNKYALSATLLNLRPISDCLRSTNYFCINIQPNGNQAKVLVQQGQNMKGTSGATCHLDTEVKMYSYCTRWWFSYQPCYSSSPSYSSGAEVGPVWRTSVSRGQQLLSQCSQICEDASGIWKG
jgi:hypothetical protein